MVQTAERAAANEESARVLARKHEILAAASRVFRRRGLQGTGMREIAEELGMAVGNLYYYFEDKEALLAFCQEQALDGLLAIAREVESLDLRADAKLYLLIVGHVVHLNEVIPGSLAHLEVEALHGKRRHEIQSRRDAYEQVYRRLLAEGSAAGIFRSLDGNAAKVASFAILGAVSWTVKWFRDDGGERARAIGREFAELLIRGLLAPDVELEQPPSAAIARLTALAPKARVSSSSDAAEDS